MVFFEDWDDFERDEGLGTGTTRLFAKIDKMG